MPTREDAWKLVCEYTQSESLRKHMLAVETCVRAYARKLGGDEDTWSIAALLHDFDYERWPNHEHAADQGHPAEAARILRERGYSDEIVRAILSHADYSGVVRRTCRLSDGLQLYPTFEEHSGLGSRFREKTIKG